MKAPRKHPTEGQVLKACIDWLWARGCFVWRNNTGSYKPEGSDRYIRFGLKGSADIIGLTPKGQFLAVETKSGYNKPEPHQLAFGEKIISHNGIYIVAYGVDDLEAHKTMILGGEK